MNPQRRAKGADVGVRPRVELAEIRRAPIDIRKIVPDELRSARFFQNRPSEKETEAFVQYLEARKPDSSDETIRGLAHLMMSTPQFQLA
jgi:hypothetical protein